MMKDETSTHIVYSHHNLIRASYSTLEKSSHMFFFTEVISKANLQFTKLIDNLEREKTTSRFHCSTVTETVMANLYNVCQKRHALTFCMTHQHSLTRNNYSQKDTLLIFGGCGSA